MEISETIVYMFIMLFGIGTFVLMQDAIGALDYGAWTFTGHAIVAAIMPFISYIYLAAMICVPIYKIMKGVN